MKAAPDYSLFPVKEEWGTGDEAMDNRLSSALKKVQVNLTIDNINEFYCYGLTLRPRAYNPAFHSTIELVTKAFLYCYDPEAYNDQLMQKLKGDYSSKKKVLFDMHGLVTILNELKSKKIYRYKGQLDFYLRHQDKEERNPFIRQPLKRAPLDLHTKIIFKEFRTYLEGELDSSSYSDSFFHALRVKQEVLLIENLGEFWYHEGQIFSFPLFDI